MVLPNRPIGYRYDRLDPTVLNVDGHTLLLAPGERADVLVDFSAVPPGSTLILYNDAPAPLPGFDPRYDQHTDAPDRTAEGGPPRTEPGYGPNTRTLLQFRVTGAPAPPYDLDRLRDRLPLAYAASQRAADRAAAGVRPGVRHPDRAGDDGAGARHLGDVHPGGRRRPGDPADRGQGRRSRSSSREHGRLAGRLGVGHPQAGPLNPTTLPLGPTDPATEVLFATDPAVPGRRPDRRHPALADQRQRPADRAAALRRLRRAAGQPGRLGRHAAAPARHGAGLEGDRPGQPPGGRGGGAAPGRPDRCRSSSATASGCSTRAARPAARTGSTPVSPADGRPAMVVNQLVNLGWEYRWHSQLAGHRDSGMSRPLVLRVAPKAPTGLTATPVPGSATALPAIALAWTSNGGRPAGHQPPAATGHRRRPSAARSPRSPSRLPPPGTPTRRSPPG